MMKNLFTLRCECDNYSITINKQVLKDLRNICIKDLIIYLIQFVLTVLMEIELSQKLGLKKGEHSKERADSRNGYYSKTWHTLIGEIRLEIPKLRRGNYRPFFLPALDYLDEQRKRLGVFSFVAGLTTRMISPLFSLLNIKPVEKSAVSVYNEKYLQEELLSFNHRDLSETDCPILMVDALYEDVRIGASLERTATIVVTGIDKYGFRQVLDIAVTVRESGETYQKVLSGLKQRGLKTPELIISDANFGIRQAIKNIFPGSLWQRCAIHLIRESLKKVSKENKSLFYTYLRRCYQASSRKESEICLDKLCQKFSKTEPGAVKTFKEGALDTFTFQEFSPIPYHKIYSSNLHERLNRSIRHRTHHSGPFPDETAYKRLVVCWLKYFCNSWEKQRYLDPEQMLSIRESGKKRRLSLEKEMGEIKLESVKEIPQTCFIYISSTPITIESATTRTPAAVILVEAANKKRQRQIIDYRLLTGFNDLEKYEQMVHKIKNCLNTEDYLIITDYGYPDLEGFIEDNFPAENIQYSLKSIPTGLLAFIPAKALESVTEIMKIFSHSTSKEKLQLVIDSLVKLWSVTLPQAASFLEEYQTYLFNFLRFTGFKSQSAATLRRIAKIRGGVLNLFSMARENLDYSGINTKVCQLINQTNQEWDSEFYRKLNKPKKKKTYIPVSKLKPPRITQEMDERWFDLLRNSGKRR